MRQSKFYATVLSVLTLLISFASFSQRSIAQEPAMQAAVPAQLAVFVAPSNSRISFVGIHVGDDPKPRLGGFANFQGIAIIDPDKQVVSSLLLDITVDSVWTQFEKLTGHLKNADFFDTGKFPIAQFVSTSLEADANGQYTITGNLTLHGVTKQIAFPAVAKVDESGLLLKAKFQLDRSEFGMDQMLSGVDKMVVIEFVIGEKTAPLKAEPGHGGDKKKQSSTNSPSQLRKVSLNVPRMI